VSPPSPSAHGRRSPSSRDAILKATEGLLLEQGVDGVSIRRVSERSGYSAPTIYHHFGDKRGLIDELLDSRFAEVVGVMRAVPRGDDPAAYLRKLALAYVRFALANPSHYHLFATPRLERTDLLPSVEEVRGMVKCALEELACEGTLGTPDVEAAFQITWAVLHGLVSLHISRSDYEFADNLVEMALDMVEHGLLRKGVRR
jgi:AcrR family transcriptional regulator